MSRREARETVLGLLFETEFRADESSTEIFAISQEDREIPADPYVEKAYFTICENREEIDAMIGKYAKGWKTSRLSKLSRSILRLAVYEMMYETEMPYSVSINEAVELAKKYDEDRARPFINGVLNAVKNELESAGGATEETK